MGVWQAPHFRQLYTDRGWSVRSYTMLCSRFRCTFFTCAHQPACGAPTPVYSRNPLFRFELRSFDLSCAQTERVFLPVPRFAKGVSPLLAAIDKGGVPIRFFFFASPLRSLCCFGACAPLRFIQRTLQRSCARTPTSAAQIACTIASQVWKTYIVLFPHSSGPPFVAFGIDTKPMAFRGLLSVMWLCLVLVCFGGVEKQAFSLPQTTSSSSLLDVKPIRSVPWR